MSDFTTWRSLIDGATIGAIPDSVVDNFNDFDDDPAGPYEEGDTLSTFYSGDTDTFERDDTSPVKFGSKSLKQDSNDKQIISTPTDGLPRYPVQGEIIEYWVYGGENTDNGNNTLFGVQDSSNYYSVQLREDADNFVIVKDGDAQETVSTSGQTPGEWQRVVIEWHDGSGGESQGEIVVEVFDDDDNSLGSGSWNDNEYTDGGIGFGRGGTSGNGTWDSYEVTGTV